MSKITISGNVILDTETQLVSGSVMFKVGNDSSFANIAIGSNEFNFSRDFILVNSSTYSMSIHCYDNENNTYSLALDDVPFPIEDKYDQFCLNSDCIINKDIIKMMFSN